MQMNLEYWMCNNTESYSYNHSKPHALTNVELYDENTISLNQCDLIYTLFNKIETIDEGDYSYEIKYYPDNNQAISTLEEDGTVISQKQYAGKAFEIDYITDKKYFYVYAYGQPIAVYIQEGENAPVPYYIHTDHLGSIDIITDPNSNIADSMSFDAWGNRRDRHDWSQKEDTNTIHLIDRGFTMHQHLDAFNLINMNGRVYDPIVQQFLSPDPYVQDPENTQNLNRYSYCLNSPLMYTDPTGEQVLGYNPYFIGSFGISHGCGGPRDEPWNYYWLGKNEFGDYLVDWFDMDDGLWGYFDFMDYFVSGGGGGSRDLGGGGGVTLQQQLQEKLESTKNGESISGKELGQVIGVDLISLAISKITRINETTFRVSRLFPAGHAALNDSPLTITQTYININDKNESVYRIQIDYKSITIGKGALPDFYIYNNRIIYYKNNTLYYGTTK